MDKLTIILVEDEPSICKIFEENIEASDDMLLLNVTNNEKEALEYINDYMPNVVILDLELHHGSGNGLNVLKGINETIDIELRPYTVITTNNISAVTYDCARELGADYIFSKYQEGYSEKGVLDFLRLMKTAIMNKQHIIRAVQQAEETPEHQKKRIRRRIMNELNKVGLNPKNVGYIYLVDAIEITMNTPVQNITTIIGEMHGKTDFSVQRAMQSAIKRAWRTANVEDLYTYYTAKIDPEKGVPTLTEFIHYYALKINNEY